MSELNPYDWIGATQADMIQFTRRQDRSLRQSYSGEPDLGLCAIMMVKDEADIISHNIRHLYRVGFRRLAILDNGSSDQTAAILRALRHSLADMEILIIDDNSLAYMQSAKTTALMQFANAFWPGLEWIFPIDADEFPCTEDGIHTLSLVPQDIDVLVIQKVNHCLLPVSLDLVLGDPFGRMPVRTDMGRQPPKVAIRAKRDVTITQGNHDAWPRTDRPLRYTGAFKYGLYLREFQHRSFEQFKRKVINGGQAVRAAESAGAFLGGSHWTGWLAAYEQGGDEKLREAFMAAAIRPPEEMLFDPIAPIRDIRT
ncbi:glycosyltransferase family 2 protein [Acidisoma cellulosilytica]|uniref:Glycosyltransferase family 2 protein n=1 Tax=Acidisoma cellulosilyticum TaxID=2802395 RepID=A0A963Z3N6_9PROT|nr:glycosyltransferase family 2 protein [Acidisoma cellulosilyticum]MCB8881322.1 glycosyltransferase family 2 protein [Acidisoma cellulosilyticum]